jgi:hypothetical protein
MRPVNRSVVWPCRATGGDVTMGVGWLWVSYSSLWMAAVPVVELGLSQCPRAEDVMNLSEALPPLAQGSRGVCGSQCSPVEVLKVRGYKLQDYR